MAENSSVDHIIASEKFRAETFASLVNIPLITRQQLALAGFIYRERECRCPQCGISIHLSSIDENQNYPWNHFRRIHREKIHHLGKRCAFLLCESGTNIDDLYPGLFAQQDEKSQWDDAEQPDFSDYSVRLQSFASWPRFHHADNSFVTPSIMAEQGFYFSGPDDGVTCFYCGNTLVDWKEVVSSNNERIVQLEHARFFPCRFITSTAGRKFVASAGYFHVVSNEERRIRNPMTSNPIVTSRIPQSIDECLLTFEDWPDDAPIAAKDLAETGFYYLGDGLSVKCYMCNLEVDNWQHGMTALGTHRRGRNDCEIICAILSTKTSEIQAVNEKWRLQTLQGLSFGSDNDEKLCRELAACGFYRFKNTRNIRCVYCGVLIQPTRDSSIMAQHRALAKQLPKSTVLDCLMVRAQCPTNVVIPDRERFPEHREYQSIFQRIQSFEIYREKHQVSSEFIRQRADAGFFLDTMKRMRCFQCGNSLSINDKKLYEKYPRYDLAKLHAHFYPTCEWVKEILGFKYVGQVLFDRRQSNDLERQHSYTTQSSLSSSSSRLTRESFSSISTSFTELNLSDYSEASDDDGYETVASPVTACFNDRIAPIQSPPLLLPTTPSKITITSPIDTVSNDDQTELSSLIINSQINPFQRLAIESKSSSNEMISTNLSPIDPDACFAYEKYRLDSFKRQHRQTFAGMKVEELANAGFYLNAEGTLVRCPRCKIELTEEKFENILFDRPIIPGSPLNDEPWTAMRVHRHEIGQFVDGERPWCPWVRREPDELYPNVSMNESRMQHPEYPSYVSIEKRIKSFELDWIFPSGTRLSNLMMADAGFIYMGDEKVCCYYCGNRLCKFEPLDCPFEEHALFYPMCDYIIHKRGFFYVDRILKESNQTRKARQKYETNGSHKIKHIYFVKAELSNNKSKRRPVRRIKSRLPSTNSDRSLSTTSENVNNDCHLCCENIAIYEYAPCRHCPMCGECSVKLTSDQHEQCMICRKQAKISEIHFRGLLDHF